MKGSIYCYSDFKEFIKDYVEDRKKREITYSYRKLSRDAGYNTSDHFQKIIKGKKRMGKDGPEKLAKAICLDEKRSIFLKYLVNFNQAKKHEQKKLFLEKLLEFELFKANNPLMVAKYQYLSKWYYLAIRELAYSQNFMNDPVWISKRLAPQISVAQAVEALINLQKLGVLKKDTDGKLIQGEEGTVDLSGEIYATGALNYHHQMIDRAKESIERFDRSLRNITTLTIPFNETKVDDIKKVIYELQKDLLERYSSKGPNTQVYQFNIQFFPLTKGS